MNYFYLLVCALGINGGGIYFYRLGPQNELQQFFYCPLDNPNYGAFSSDGKQLYVTFETSGQGMAAAFKIQPDGKLTILNTLNVAGVTPCHLAVFRNFVFTANYSSGDISVLETASDGSLLKLEKRFKFHDATKLNPRQEASHPHFCGITPDGKFLAVADLGADNLKLFNLDSESGEISGVPEVFPIHAPGAGPRHLAFSPDGQNLWVVDELANLIHSLQYQSGKLLETGRISTLPAEYNAVSYAGAIRLSPDGKFLLVTNRGSDTLAVFRISSNGQLALHQTIDCGGRYPRDINFTSDGKFLICGNELSDSVTFFSFDRQTGKLTALPLALKHRRPIAILPVAL